MKGKITHIKDMSFTGTIGKHSLTLDDGKNYATPMQVLLLSLATCTAMDVWHIMTKKRQNIKNLDVEIEGKRKEEYPKIFTKIKLKYIFDGDVDETACQQSINLSIQKYCSISGMLKKIADIETSYTIR